MLRLSTEGASRAIQPVDAVKHVFMLYKFAAIGLFDAFLHASDESGLIVEHPGNRVFHQLLGVLARGRGHLLEPRLDLGGEMYFHALSRYPKTGNLATRETKAPELAHPINAASAGDIIPRQRQPVLHFTNAQFAKVLRRTAYPVALSVLG